MFCTPVAFLDTLLAPFIVTTGDNPSEQAFWVSWLLHRKDEALLLPAEVLPPQTMQARLTNRNILMQLV